MLKKILILFVLISPLCAQVRDVSLRFLYFGADGQPPEIFAAPPEGEPVACLTPTAGLSVPKIYSVGENTLKLVSKDKGLVSNASVPASSKNAIVIIIQTAKEPKLQWRTIVIDDNKKVFPHGGAFVVNFNASDIRFEIGEHKGSLKRASYFGYEMPNKRDDFNMAPILFWNQQNDKWLLISESMARFLPDYRYIFISYTHPISNRPTILTIQDSVYPTEQPVP